ncbi:MAG TPA: hypothetical protein VGF31_09170 [Myxococcaceae bacterium]|jgi:hypothetical protein
MLRRLVGTVLASVMVVAALPGARAADAGTPGAAKAATTQQGFESLVAALSGSWVLAIRFEPPKEGARSTESTGTARWYTSVDGQVLLEDEHLPVDKTDMKLLGLIWWDGKRQALAGLLCSNRSPRTCDPKASLDDITLSWDGARLLIEEIEHQRDGSVLLFRESYSEITPRSYLQLGEIGPPGGPFRRIFTVHGTRSKN